LDIEEVPDDEICFVTTFNSEAKEPDNTDTYEDLVTFVQPAMTDVLDEANEDTYALLASLDSGFVEPIANDLLPTVNVHLHDIPVSTDTVNSYLHAIDTGETTALLLARPDSLVADVEGRKTKDLLIVDQSRLADRRYRQHHSHGETTAQSLEAAGANLRSSNRIPASFSLRHECE
jgi:hypothetical protein